MEKISVDIMIAGAGPAGLTAASLLARQGVNAVTFSKYGTANSPRAHITNQRAVEILRDLGIEDRVKARALPHHLMGKQVFATSFAGRELSRMMTWGTGDNRIGDYRSASPCEMCNAPQHILEPILLQRAGELGADIRLHHEVLSITPHEDRVTALVRRTQDKQEIEIEARYVIGCDGAGGIVAQQGGFEFEGRMGIGDAVTVWIEADLSEYTAHRSGALFFAVTPGSPDFISAWTCVEPWNEWSTIFLRQGLTPNDLDESVVAESVRAAIGDDSIKFNIKRISPWQFNHVVAANYRADRIFIAGDAAHRHPPANGLGSNTSMQDSYNLAWKLALVVNGAATDTLLDTYNEERQPVGRRIVDRANLSAAEMLDWFGAVGLSPDMTPDAVESRLAVLFGPDGEDERQSLFAAVDKMNGQFNAHGVELGQQYESSAVVACAQAPGEKPAERNPDLYHEPTTRPGRPIPHVWVTRGKQELSTLDLCAYDAFTLLTGAAGAPWIDAAAKVGEILKVNIHAVSLSLGLTTSDAYGDWARIREVADDGCILVRPDRIIGWRAMNASDNPFEELHQAVAAILGQNAG